MGSKQANVTVRVLSLEDRSAHCLNHARKAVAQRQRLPSGEGRAVARRGERRVSQSGALPTGLADGAGHEGISPDPKAGAEHQEDGGDPHGTG